MAEIYKKISDVMNDIDAISKNRKNTQGSGYNFRGIDDVYNELHSVLSKHHVFTVPEVLEERTEERVSKSGGNLIYRILKIKYTFFTEDGSSVTSVVIGEAMDSGDKAANKAMSVAHKYCLLQVFAIPTEEEKDPEVETHEPLPKKEVVTKHYISDAQLKLLNTEISKRDIDRDKLKTFLKVDSLKDVTTAEFELVLENVRKKPIRQREPGEETE
jgi:hypothetical protein